MKNLRFLVFIFILSECVNHEGEVIKYGVNGRVKSITQYENGKKSGLELIFNLNGDTSIISHWKNNYLHGPYTELVVGRQYFLEFEYFLGKKYGPFRKYNFFDSTITAGTFVADKESGEFRKISFDSTLIEYYHYHAGEIQNSRVYNGDGGVSSFYNLKLEKQSDDCYLMKFPVSSLDSVGWKLYLGDMRDSGFLIDTFQSYQTTFNEIEFCYSQTNNVQGVVVEYDLLGNEMMGLTPFEYKDKELILPNRPSF